MNSSYITSAQKANQLPTFESDEIAFIGKSNCGKSSLLNSIFERKNLAKSSSTPGRTQMINFFSLSSNKDQVLIFADLPGYGFNVASKSVKKHWNDLMNAYISRNTIKEFICILDCRRDMDDFETEYWKYLSDILPIIVAVTKTDKISQSQVRSKLTKLQSSLESNKIHFKKIFPISNLKKSGVQELRGYLLKSRESAE